VSAAIKYTMSDVHC